MHLEETVSLTNGTGAAISNLVLRAPWNHWKGVFALRSAKVNGQDAEVSWHEEINFEVRLPQSH